MSKEPKLKYYFVQYAWEAYPGDGATIILSAVGAWDEKDVVRLFCQKVDLTYQSGWMPIEVIEINTRKKKNVTRISEILAQFFSIPEADRIFSSLFDGACDFKFERSINYG